MTNRRVVVTGIGAISPVGNDAETGWKNIIEGKSGIGPLTRLNAEEFPVKVAAEIKEFDIETYINRKEARKMDRFTHYAIAASVMAYNDSKLEITDENAARVRSGSVRVSVGWRHLRHSMKTF